MTFQKGFDIAEAKSILAFCTHLETYTEVNKTSLRSIPALPADWEILRNIQIPGLDQGFQLGITSAGPYFLVLKGIPYTPATIQDDFEVDMVHAESFSQDKMACIQRGFRTNFEVICPFILAALQTVIPARPISLLVGGHGQGAALAALCVAFLKHHKDFRNRVKAKSYLFAAPRIGNVYFAREFNYFHAEKGYSFRIIHNKDFVPYIPLGPELSAYKPTPYTSFLGVGRSILLDCTVPFHGTTLCSDAFQRHRAFWYYKYLDLQFPSDS